MTPPSHSLPPQGHRSSRQSVQLSDAALRAAPLTELHLRGNNRLMPSRGEDSPRTVAGLTSGAVKG